MEEWRGEATSERKERNEQKKNKDSEKKVKGGCRWRSELRGKKQKQKRRKWEEGVKTWKGYFRIQEENWRRKLQKRNIGKGGEKRKAGIKGNGMKKQERGKAEEIVKDKMKTGGRNSKSKEV